MLRTLIEYSASNVNKENNSGMILDGIFNYQLEIIRKYFGILIDMEIVLKCEYPSINFTINDFMIFESFNWNNILDHFNQKLHQQKVSLTPKQ